ncbi:lipid droplet assembly factor 1-like [Cololabis saira]|uniref:lipid droplet assembly factor 1-like n=1 Tax=Cololabis saira TaxID=129043 RepID=UPI002AD458CE|nr:lipid droplet assembly factor 1-like [Cololabis saira]
MQRSSGLTQQLWERWMILVRRIQDDPRAARLMSTRIGQYLSCHPFSALTLLLFGAMAALPVGLFLTFALLTIVISVVGFVFFEAFLLFVGGSTLLAALTGIAFFSFLVSAVINSFFITIPNLLKRYPPLAKKGVNQEREGESETAGLKAM